MPTRNRPSKLQRCLAALAQARAELSFHVLVCDSSDDEHHAAVLAVCSTHSFVTVRRHGGRNVAAARNACAQCATGEILVNVDDDIQVDPAAIVEIIRCYSRAPKPCVIAGSVAWDGVYSRPIVMRHNGYGRSARDDESPSFLVGALFAYPRQLALLLPWNERIRTSDDRFMGALWRSHRVHLGYAPAARAIHDPEHVKYDVDEQTSHIYANLFDAAFANPSLTRTLCYEFFGFAVGTRAYCRTTSDARRYATAWIRGNKKLIRDRKYLSELVSLELPETLRTS